LHLRHVPSDFYARTRPLQQARPAWREAVVSALREDAAAANISTEVADPYGFGKEISRMGRLALVADELAENGNDEFRAMASDLRARMKRTLQPWLAGRNTDTLLFDTTWGGLVPRNGLKDFGADFGAGLYNDHHFHYGYFIYALAVIAKEDRSWAQQYREHILTFVRDIANPAGMEGEDSGAADPFFPTLRHTDVFDGHSWANGLFSNPSGRNSESSSEAINAYASIALLGRAMGDVELAFLGDALTSLEVTGVKKYWHMTPERSAFGEEFASNGCVGMLWSEKAVVETWFAVGLAYVHAINLLPITPVSEFILTKGWVSEQYPILERSLPHSRPRMDDPWLGLVTADQAVIDPEAAWTRAQTFVRYDNGNSKTNLLYWIATRP
jgi:endo-1,3(4)-beta-glucanase